MSRSYAPGDPAAPETPQKKPRRRPAGRLLGRRAAGPRRCARSGRYSRPLSRSTVAPGPPGSPARTSLPLRAAPRGGVQVHGLVMQARSCPARSRLPSSSARAPHDSASLQAALAARGPGDLQHSGRRHLVAASSISVPSHADLARGPPPAPSRSAQRSPDPPAPGVELRDLRGSDEPRPQDETTPLCPISPTAWPRPSPTRQSSSTGTPHGSSPPRSLLSPRVAARGPGS